MHIIFLDGSTTDAGDLSWDRLAAHGELTVYPASTEEEACERVRDADVVFFNAFMMNRRVITAARRLRFLGIAATGFDNLDVAAARERGIACTNVPAYATEAVAQHTIALLLEAADRVGLHVDDVRRHGWNEQRGSCYWLAPMTLLAGKSIGIAGYGRIGRRVAAIAAALGMEVHIYRREPEAALGADVLSLHLPAVPETIGFLDAEKIARMKDGAILLNTGRGALVDESAVAAALRSGHLAAYAADVLQHEPPAADDPLLGLDNCFITPHHAWCQRETRQHLLDLCCDNLESWLAGGTLNRIDLNA
ncbi:MAG: NAD(P)-dependent oxidoreductase [Anaerovoracaceae bacterium]|jgi:glycerate dehydrogenase